MVDNIEYFDIVCNSYEFQKLAIVLFFNNNKEFEQVFEKNKIVKININSHAYDDDIGDDDIFSHENDEFKTNHNQERYTFDSSSDGLNFIQEKYIQIATKSLKSRKVYTPVSTEGSDNLQRMLLDVKQIVVQINLIKSGLVSESSQTKR